MSNADSSHDTVFGRRWVLAEDELLQMLWRCHGGENPDIVLVELHAHRRVGRFHRAHGRGNRPRGGRGPRVTRHYHRRDGHRLDR